MSEQNYLTTDEVLDYLQINVRTIYRLIRRGKIPAVRVGRQWRFRKKDIDYWLASNRSSTHPGDAVERPRILVVDDEPAIRDLVAKTFANNDYDVDTAADGASALDCIHSTEYDLLITDLKMPGMDGLSVIREARRRFADLPVIIMTGFSTEASAIEALNMGSVSGYLTKPFRMERMVAIAARALGEPPSAIDA